jgi:hypothetical protein
MAVSDEEVTMQPTLPQSGSSQSGLPQSRKIRWNRLVILIAGVLGVLLACCIGVVTLAPNLRQIIQAPFWKTDTQLAAQAAHKMLDYDLPPGYQESQVLSVQGQDAAVIIAHRERTDDMIFIEHVTEGILGNEEWRASYETRLSREMGVRRYDTRPVGTQQTTIRGQPMTLRFFEGTDENGRKIRQVVCGFTGKGGDVLLAIVAGQETWDQAMVDRFLQSIR